METARSGHKHLYKCLGEVISLRRKRMHMSQEDLAQESGINRAFISNIEQGKRNPSFGAVSCLSRGLRIRYSRLIEKCEDCMKESA
jgi:transcriptional regulator with XRE-family HTH domain